MSTSLISPVSSSSSSTSQSQSQSSPAGIANESTFLTLLVTQLKNQDPLSPTDSTQFVSQLAQFSSLEQLTNINTNVGTLTSVIDPSAATSTSSSSTSASVSSGSSTSSSSSGSAYDVDSTLNNALLNDIG